MFSTLPWYGMALCLVAFFAVERSEAGEAKWVILPGITSAALASEQARIVTSSGMSWPDGRQALISFWISGAATYRCIDFFGSDAASTGGVCFGPDGIKTK